MKTLKTKKRLEIDEGEKLIKEILQNLDFSSKRATKMDTDDFLELYLEFKKNDIDFI